jgi:hypothetical protein
MKSARSGTSPLVLYGLFLATPPLQWEFLSQSFSVMTIDS